MNKILVEPLKYWSNPQAANDIILKYNELVDVVNNLTEKLRVIDQLLVDIHQSLEESPEELDS